MVLNEEVIYMIAWIILAVNGIIGPLLVAADSVYCTERMGGKWNHEMHIRTYEVDNAILNAFHDWFGKLLGKMIGALCCTQLWLIYIPVHRLMILKQFKEQRKLYMKES